MIVVNTYTIGAAILAALVVVIVLALLLRSLRKSWQRWRSGRGQRQLRPQRQRNTSSLLQGWVEYTLGTGGVAQWLKDLNRRETKALVDEMMAFGANYGFDPNWVLKAAVEVDPQLNEKLTKSLVDWLTARYNAVQAQDEVALFRRYEAIINDPRDTANLALIQRLYTRLVEAGAVPPTPANLILSTDKARQVYAVEQIEKAAKADWTAFAAILQTALDDRQGASRTERRGLRRRTRQPSTSSGVAVPVGASS